MTQPELCPRTQQPCENWSLCASMKEVLEEGGIAPASPRGLLFEEYPYAFQAYNSSHCVDERIAALDSLAGIVGISAREIEFGSITVRDGLRRAKTISIADPAEL